MAITAEQRAAAKAARADRIAGTRRTTRPGSESTLLKVGDSVRCDCPRYRRREGRVVAVNRQAFPEGRGTYVELGVKFRKGGGQDADAWFRDDELIREKAEESVLEARTAAK